MRIVCPNKPNAEKCPIADPCLCPTLYTLKPDKPWEILFFAGEDSLGEMQGTMPGELEPLKN
jgi:hypothetical protein